MNILILGFSKIKYMPYLNFYYDTIKKYSNVEILYWNRDLQSEDLTNYQNVKFHEFKYYLEDDIKKRKKINAFFNYRKYAKKILIENNYDKIIVLTSLTGLVLIDILLRKYRYKYIFDYRDSTYEENKIYKSLIGLLEKKSVVTFVSSDAFRKYLPIEDKNKIYTSHNILLDSLKHRDDKEKYGIKSDKVRISFWGFIRHKDINLKLIDAVSKDNRFELHYYGREQEIAKSLKKYVKDNKMNNIFFHGEYKPKDRYEFIKNTDIIHNIYDDTNMRLAMGNKYYDGIIFKIPQICLEESYMGERVEKANIGISVDVSSKKWLEEIYDFYQNINFDVFKKNCDIELKHILDEYREGIKKIEYEFE